YPVSVGAGGLFAAIVPIAFAFDGWVIATSICGEIKNSKRNLPRAMILSPVLILAVYVAYFIGISALVGPEQILALGDAHVEVAATTLFGPIGAKLIVIFVIISVLGTSNGLILGGMRLPYALGLRGMMPGKTFLTKENEKLGGMPVGSTLVMLIGMLFWWVIHFLSMKFNLLPGSDISEIAIVVHYLLFIPLYLSVMVLTKKGRITNKFYGYISPVLACVGSLVVLIGGFQNKLFPLYLVICGVVVLASLVYFAKHKAEINH
ncbi:MAG: APC family permease, partial [Pygmaiobacter sp.]